MPSPITDEAFAERLLRYSLDGEPALSEEQIADLMQIAVSLNDVFVPEYTEANLNRAASLGWQFKSALTAKQFDVGGSKTADRSQWHKHCVQQAADFADGTKSVLGGDNVAGGTRRSGIGVISLTSSMAMEGDY